jgi:acyl-CoA oxidase
MRTTVHTMSVNKVLLCNRFREMESQILDYMTQQYKLFPYLAASFAIKFTAISLQKMYSEVAAQLEGGDLERLPEVNLYNS